MSGCMGGFSPNENLARKAYVALVNLLNDALDEADAAYAEGKRYEPASELRCKVADSNVEKARRALRALES